MTKPLSICVVGHTNVGKTSLLRTLLKDDTFGTIANESATTRHVEKSVITDTQNVPLLYLYDTPGMEDATGVMAYLTAYSDEREDGIDRLTAFLAAVNSQYATLPRPTESLPTPDEDFSQEAKVILATLNADLCLYVIDSRFAPTAKYKDELALLAFSATPVLPVFNFVGESRHIDAWQALLKRKNLHVWVSFDTVSFEFEREIILWQSCATLLNTPPKIVELIDERKQLWQKLQTDAHHKIADFLISVASYTQKISENTDPAPTQLAMQTAVEKAQTALIGELLNSYRFYHTKASIEPIMATLNQLNLAHSSVKTAKGGTIGAMLGAGFDVITLGASLGAGTLVGGLLGGGLANAETLKDKLAKQKRLVISDTSLLILANQLLALHQGLRRTGHATDNAIAPDSSFMTCQTLPKALQKARAYPNFSHLPINPNNLTINRPSRQKLTTQLSEQLPTPNQMSDL